MTRFKLITSAEEYANEVPFFTQTKYHNGGWFTFEFFSGDRVSILDSTKSGSRGKLEFVIHPHPKLLAAADIRLSCDYPIAE